MQNSYRDGVVKRPAYAVGSVDSALQLLDLLIDDAELTVSGSADVLHVARSTAHRLLSTLVYRGFAERTGERTYVLGPALRREDGASGNRALVARVRPALQALAARTGETATFVEWRGLDARFLFSAEGTRRVRVSGRAGTVLPAHLTSATKPCLAELPWPDVHALLTSRAARERGGAPGPDELAALREELAEIARTGLASNVGATEPDVAARGIGVRAPDGLCRFGISLSAPITRADELLAPEAAAALRAASAEVGALLPAAP